LIVFRGSVHTTQDSSVTPDSPDYISGRQQKRRQ